MTPAKFPQANTVLNPPSDLDESQCVPINAGIGTAQGGNMDGINVIVVAWLPSEEDRKKIVEGGLIFLGCIGGLPPHFLATEFFPTNET